MKLTIKDVKAVENPEFRMMNNRVGLFNSSYQDFKRYGIPKAQLILTDIPYCYDEDTECFTTDGWKRYNDITNKDVVLSINTDTMKMEYASIENIIIRDCDEDMIHFTSKDNLDMFVSSNHRVWAKRTYRTKTFGGVGVFKTISEIRLAKEINPHTNFIPRAGYSWKDGYTANDMIIPPCEIKTRGKEHIEGEKRIAMNNWLAFFGLWLADGCTCESKGDNGRQLYTISIKQAGDKRENVRQILNQLPFNWHEYENKGTNKSNFNIYSKQLWLYLHQFGKSRDKFIPRWVLDLPKGDLETFWHYYCFGDSHKNGDGIKISSVSLRLIEGLQEISLKLGVLCNIRRKKTKSGYLYYFQFNKDSRDIKFRSKNIISDYKGKMWCLTLGHNSVFLVRRNGTMYFCGNCLGSNAYGSNPSWYIGGDNKNGESELAGESFFVTDENFKPAEFMHFAAQMLRPEPKEKQGRTQTSAPCMIVFCEFMQQFYLIELAKRYGFNHYINLVFRKNYSAQVLKANMRIVGNCEYGLVLYRDKLPKFNNNGQMVFNCMDWSRDLGMPKIAPTQKPIPLLKRLIELFTDPDDVVIDPCAGSGSTLVAAASLGRKAYGLEISKRFYTDACEALKNNIEIDMFSAQESKYYQRKLEEQSLF